MLKWRRGLPTGAERAATGADSSGRPGDPKTAGTWARTRSWHMARWHCCHSTASPVSPLPRPYRTHCRVCWPRQYLPTHRNCLVIIRITVGRRVVRPPDATECGSTTVRVNTGCRVVRGVYNSEIHSIEVNVNVSIFLTRSKCPKCFKLKRIRSEHCCSLRKTTNTNSCRLMKGRYQGSSKCDRVSSQGDYECINILNSTYLRLRGCSWLYNRSSLLWRITMEPNPTKDLYGSVHKLAVGHLNVKKPPIPMQSVQRCGRM